MPRIRTIKPEFPQSESMGRVSRDARLLFVQLWTLCDDYGRSRANSRALASLLFPYDDDAPTLIQGWLSELEKEGCVYFYEHAGQHYLQIENWSKHQRVDHPSPAQFPDPRESSRIFAKNSRDLATSRARADQGPRTKEGTKEGIEEPLLRKGHAKENFAPDGAPVLKEVVSNGYGNGAGHSSGMAESGTGAGESSQQPPPGSPLDLKTELWRVGKKYLAEHGIGERQAGSLIGKWRKSHGDHEVLDALTQAQISAASEPVAYIEARFRKKSSNGKGSVHSPPKKIIGCEIGSREWWQGVKDSPGYLTQAEYSEYEKKYGR